MNAIQAKLAKALTTLLVRAHERRSLMLERKVAKLEADLAQSHADNLKLRLEHDELTDCTAELVRQLRRTHSDRWPQGLRTAFGFTKALLQRLGHGD